MSEAEREKLNNAQVVNDYKMVRQRLDMQLNVAKQELESLKVNFGEIHKIRCEILVWFQVKISDCRDCSKFGENLSENWHIGSGDQSSGDERIKELELELAQTKLAHVEAECRNQVRIFLIGFNLYFYVICIFL